MMQLISGEVHLMKTSRKKIFDSLSTYMYAGKLPLMLCLIPFFINNKKGMELFRERLDLSIQGTLKRRYYKKSITVNYQSPILKKLDSSQNIWFMWLQGIEHAPQLCQANFSYLKRNHGNVVHLITLDNVFNYIELPDFIKDKWENGVISNTHFSDIVRLQLLSTYGGTWIDATVFVNKHFLNNLTEFCLPQTYKPGSNGHALPVSSWFIHAPVGNRYIRRVRDLLFLYWEKNNRLINYFLVHHFMVIASEEMDNYLNIVYPLDNSMPHYPMLLMKKRKVSKLEIESFLKNYNLMKFTYKTENRLENDNYVKLINSIKLL